MKMKREEDKIKNRRKGSGRRDREKKEVMKESNKK
jgi:hypothetical protein